MSIVKISASLKDNLKGTYKGIDRFLVKNKGTIAKHTLNSAARSAIPTAAAFSALSAIGTHVNNQGKKEEDKKSVGKAALKGGAVGAGIGGLYGAGEQLSYNAGVRQGLRRGARDSYKSFKKNASKSIGLSSLKTTSTGALIGAGVGAGRQALKNRKLKPEEKKSVSEAAKKGAVTGGVSGLLMAAPYHKGYNRSIGMGESAFKLTNKAQQ